MKTAVSFQCLYFYITLYLVLISGADINAAPVKNGPKIGNSEGEQTDEKTSNATEAQKPSSKPQADRKVSENPSNKTKVEITPVPSAKLNQTRIAGNDGKYESTKAKEEVKSTLNNDSPKSTAAVEAVEAVEADEDDAGKNGENEAEAGSEESNDGKDSKNDNVADSADGLRKNASESMIGIGDVEDSHFFYYILFLIALGAIVYVGAHNKKRILGLLIEGRRPSSTRRSGVRYRRLSQRDDGDSLSYKDAESSVIY